MTDFVHLHVHSHYSLLDSTVKLGALVEKAASLDMSAVALTDHMRMSGALELQNRAKKTGVKPIHGLAVQVEPIAANPHDPKPDHQLILLAENLTGYQNLVKIVSHAWHDDANRYHGSEKSLPRASWDTIRAHHDGVICLTGDLGGEIPTWILRREQEKADEVAQKLVEIFGRGNVFLELQRSPGVPELEETCEALIAMGQRLDLPLVATGNVHYLNEGDHVAHGILTCVGLEKRVTTEMLDMLPIKDLYLASADDMKRRFVDVPEAIANTVRIAERCNVVIPTGTYYLPAFPVPDGYTEDALLKELAIQGLEDRFKELDAAQFPYEEQEYRDRLEMEYGVIAEMGYAGYFLIVGDFIGWARKNRIPVGPGRGSGAGSIIAWALRITDLNPLRYSLLFERFLNPERVSMPDFDVDFCTVRRGEVIQYVAEKYGRDNVGLIITFGQLKAKAVLRDVARVLNVDQSEVNRLCAMIPSDPASQDIPLPQHVENIPELREAFENDAMHQELYRNCLAIEGTVRNSSVHPAGVVIGKSALWDYVPVIVGESGELVSQFAKSEVEQAGLVKFDFLGLKNLTVIQDALDMIEGSTGEVIDFNRVNRNDPETYRVIQRGDTSGIFQMESEGFQKLMKRLKPNLFEDLIAAVALYRPGPLGSGMVDTYIDCKHGIKEPDYLHPLLEGVLKETFGVMVYQEQVMQAAQRLAGYSLGGADLLRRAMGKKNAKDMAAQRTKFIEGAIQNNVDEAKASEIFDLIGHFAGYGFNKSHSAAYAMVAFQTAYLKAHYPAAFYAALMTSDSGRPEKIARFILDARQRDIGVLPPDVNYSNLGFTIVDGNIRFGLGAIKGLGEGPIAEIVEQRAISPFTSLFDFCERVPHIASKQVENLIRAGAFDSLYLTPDETTSIHAICLLRARLFETVASALARGEQTRRDAESGQASLLDMFAAAPTPVNDELVDAKPWTDTELLRYEKELISVYVSGHPFTRYVREARLYADTTTATMSVDLTQGPRRGGKQVRIAGMIEEYKSRTTRSGSKMANFRLEDLHGEVKAVVFSRSFDEVDASICLDEPVIVTGRLSADERSENLDVQLVVDEVQTLSSVRQGAVDRVHIQVDAREIERPAFETLWRIIDEHAGTCALHMSVRFDEALVSLRLHDAPRVDSSDVFIRAVESVLGEGTVVLGVG